MPEVVLVDHGKYPVLDKTIELLRSKGVEFVLTEHESVYTSEQAAKVRGTPIETGAKALVCKAGDDFCMFVMSAHMKLHTKAVRKALGIQRLRFATKEELLDLTGLEPGCVPPFGSLFGLETHCDESLSLQGSINFNVGVHSVSINMTFEDWVRVETPNLGGFAKI